jgi:hypothetical protein
VYFGLNSGHENGRLRWKLSYYKQNILMLGCNFCHI